MSDDKLTRLVEALAVIEAGWGTESEGREYHAALGIVQKHVRRQRLARELQELQEQPMSDWIREEAARQIDAMWEWSRERGISTEEWNRRKSPQALAESCLRAGMAHEQEAIRRVEFERGKRAGLREAARRCDERAEHHFGPHVKPEPADIDTACALVRGSEARAIAAELRALADSTPATARKALPSEPGTGTPDSGQGD